MSVRGLTSYPFQGFGKGLNLRDKPDAIDPAEAIDLLNVSFSDRGAIEQRPGYDNLTGSALTNRVASLEPFYTSSGTKQLLAGCGTRLEALEASGAVKASATGLTNAVWDFVRFGKPNAEVAYAGNGTDTLRKWDGASWTAPTATVDGEAAKAMPKAGALAVWPAGGNRLVATGFSTTTGGPNGATSSPDHVWFSDPGNPEAWHTKTPEENDVQLMPGNGEPIKAVIAWRELLFVFKETVFFVFYGVGVNTEGSPEFLFRAVEAGVGMVSPRAVCVHRTGVYFMSRQGVYRTTGEEPELISSLIEPLWTGDVSPFFKGGVIAQGSITECAMGVHQDRIYLSYPTISANNRTLVYDPKYDWWSLYTIPASCLASFRPSSSPELVFGYASGEKYVGRHTFGYTNDDGTAIESFWRSGWFDLANPDVKTLRSAKVWGSGIVEMDRDSDFLIGAGPSEKLEMIAESGSVLGGEGILGGEGFLGDTAQDLVEAYLGTDVRGTVFSVYFNNTTLNQDWSIHRIDHHLREVRMPSTAVA